MLSKYEKFDVIVALNVIPHTINVKEILEYVGKLLSEDGIFFMEGAYFFDTIYKESLIRFIMSMYLVLLCIV